MRCRNCDSRVRSTARMGHLCKECRWEKWIMEQETRYQRRIYRWIEAKTPQMNIVRDVESWLDLCFRLPKIKAAYHHKRR